MINAKPSIVTPSTLHNTNITAPGSHLVKLGKLGKRGKAFSNFPQTASPRLSRCVPQLSRMIKVPTEVFPTRPSKGLPRHRFLTLSFQGVSPNTSGFPDVQRRFHDSSWGCNNKGNKHEYTQPQATRRSSQKRNPKELVIESGKRRHRL